MGSSNKRPRVTFTAQEVLRMCARDGNDDESDIDSVTGGISSNEELQLDIDRKKQFRG